MEIRVGIIGRTDGWEILLRQEGIPFSPATEGEQIGRFSAIVTGDNLSANEFNRLRTYLRSGGGVLCSARVFSEIASVPAREHFLRSLLPEPDSKFSRMGFVDVFSTCAIPEEANGVIAGGEFSPIEREFGGGYLVVLPFDAAALILDGRQAAKSFYARSVRLPFERVSLVSRAGVRKLVSRALEILHHRRGLPFIHLWYYPRDAPSVFCFRIDTDNGDRDEIEELYDLSRSSGIPFTWFLDMRSQEKALPIYQKMEGQEIGVHCYEHKRYRSAENAVEDIGRALELLRRAHIDPRGLAAPYGQWGDAIQEAVAHFSFDYSSEFSYDYDNIPSRVSALLQVPIHPISIGTLRRQGFDRNSMEEYFHDLINQNYLRREPIIFYHHPMNRHNEVVKSIFSCVRGLQVPAMCMIDYARWWKERDAHSLQVEAATESCTLHSTMRSPTHWLHFTRENGTEAFTPIAEEVRMDSLTWEPVPVVPPLPEDIRRIRKFNPWIPLQRAEDFIMKPFARRR